MQNKLSAAALKEHLEEMERQWDSKGDWAFNGVLSGYTLLDEICFGFKDGLYLFAAGAGAGKTSFITNLLFQLMLENPKALAIFYSLDQAYLDLVARMFAMSAELPIDLIKNPQKIKERLELEKRLNGFEILNTLKERMLIYDQSHAKHNLKEIEKELNTLRSENQEVPIFLVIDQIMELELNSYQADKDKSYLICKTLKEMARKYKVAIIMSANTDLADRSSRPKLKELEDKVGLVYGSDLVALLYNDSLNDFETPFLDWEWGTDNLMIPLVEVNIVKNKQNKEYKRLFYRFYNDMTRYKECTKAENEHYNEMLNNLDHFEKDPKKRKESLKKKVYVAPKRKEYEGIF